LLDTCAVIGFLEMHVWGRIIKAHEIYVPSSVIRETKYYPEGGRKVEIDLTRYSRTGSIKEISISSDMVRSVLSRFDPVLGPSLGIGELEAIAALVHSKVSPETRICTADKAGVKALALLLLVDRGISIEEVLDISGLRRPVKYAYSRKAFEKARQEGVEMLVQGRGLAQSPDLTKL